MHFYSVYLHYATCWQKIIIVTLKCSSSILLKQSFCNESYLFHRSMCPEFQRQTKSPSISFKKIFFFSVFYFFFFFSLFVFVLSHWPHSMELFLLICSLKLIEVLNDSLRNRILMEQVMIDFLSSRMREMSNY